MIPFASQRSLGQDLATHLMNEHDNEVMVLAEVRGAIAQDLHGAFAEWEAQAHALTKCQNYLYSLSINPDPAQEPLTRTQYDDYIARVENKLGLSGQPRAIVFHEKYGREHCHVVWSRIDASKEKAVQLAFDKDKLMMVTREFARDHGLQLPDGYFKDSAEKAKNSQLSLYEMHQQRATGLTKEERMEQVTDAWRSSDSPKSLVQALAARGYILATGKRPYVLVDLYGEMNALPKLISDKTIRTKDIRAFLGKEFPPDSLPSVEEARDLAARHRRAIESHAKEEQRDAAMEELARAQDRRREKLEEGQSALKNRQHETRLKLAATQKAEHGALRSAHLQQGKQIRQEREQKRSKGLAAFLGRVSGIALIRKKLHRYQDKKRLRIYIAERGQLKRLQDAQRLALSRRQEMRTLDIQRRVRALAQIEQREKRSLEQSLRAETRIAARGGENRIPAIPLDLARSGKPILAKDMDYRGRQELERQLEEEFEQAASGRTKQKQIDLESEFTRAAKGRDEEKEGGSSEGPKPASENKIKRYGRKRGRNKDFDRGR